MSDTPFEEVLNVYMVTYHGVSPYNPQRLGGVEVDGTLLRNLTAIDGYNASAMRWHGSPFLVAGPDTPMTRAVPLNESEFGAAGFALGDPS